MIPPRGFKAEIFPLRHNLKFAFGLSAATETVNSTMCTMVKNYKAANAPNTINVNPHNPDFKRETGAICAGMSIIDQLSISVKLNLTEDSITDGMKSLNVIMMPIFTVFGEKLDSVDEKTTTTAAASLELTKDATQEDITPAFATDLPVGSGNSSSDHPVGTVNFTEVFGTLNLGTDLVHEGVPWTEAAFHDALRYYTNKGAIRSMIGRSRNITLTDNRPTKSIYIRKFVPRAVRRILPYSFFAMLFHVPIINKTNQFYSSGLIGASKPNIGVKMMVNYHEWNADHDQEMA